MAGQIRLVAAACVGVVLGTGLVAAQEVRQGAAAFGDWHSDAPGVMRHIGPGNVGPDKPANAAKPAREKTRNLTDA